LILKNDRIDNVIYFIMDRTYRKSRQYSMQRIAAAGFDVTLDQWVVVLKVSENPGISQKEVADSTFKDAATLTRIIDLLEKKGYIERLRSPHDRRKFELHLTEEGHRLVTELRPLVHEIREIGTEGIKKEDLETAKRVLNQMFSNFD
jgi:DNA-binding MarR family transcriptional regulator